MILVVVLFGLLLITSPGLVPVGRRHPVHWTRNALAVQLTGFALAEAGLLLWAAPVLLDLVGATGLARVCRLVLGGPAPGGWPAGAAAAAAATVLAGLGVRGAWRVRSAQRRMRVEPWVGVHQHRADHQLVVLPSDDLLAYTVGGRPPQVVISQGLVDRVGEDLTDAVCAHEAVHARCGHHRLITALGAISSAFGWFPPVRRSVAMVRLALERWADEEAASVTSGGRGAVRGALLAVSLARLDPDVAAFGSADTIAERARALSAPAPLLSLPRVAVGYLSVWLAIVVVVAGSLAWASRVSIVVASDPGLCWV